MGINADDFWYQAKRFERQIKDVNWWTFGGLIRAYHLLMNHQGYITQVNVADRGKNGLGLMVGDIKNIFCTVTCTENIWSICGQ